MSKSIILEQRNDSPNNELLPWQTVEFQQSMNYYQTHVVHLAQMGKSSSTIHSQPCSNLKEASRRKRNMTYTMPAQKQRFNTHFAKEGRNKVKDGWLKTEFQSTLSSKGGYKTAEISCSSCPLKVMPIISQIFASRPVKQANFSQHQYRQKLNAEGLQQFTNIAIKSIRCNEEERKKSFADFLDLKRRQLKQKKLIKRKVQIFSYDIEPAIHVKTQEHTHQHSKTPCKNPRIIQLPKKAIQVLNNISIKQKRRKLLSTKHGTHYSSPQPPSLQFAKYEDLKSFSLFIHE